MSCRFDYSWNYMAEPVEAIYVVECCLLYRYKIWAVQVHVAGSREIKSLFSFIPGYWGSETRSQCAKKVVFDIPGLVHFAVQL